MQIRRFEPKDQEGVRDLIEDILAKEFESGHKAYSYCDLDSISRVYGGKREAFFVLEDDGKVIGTAGVKEESKEAAIIRRLFVLPSQRKKGLGGLLLDRAIEFCKKNGYKDTTFHAATPMVSAIKLCESRGFRKREELVLGGVDIIRFSLGLRG